MNILNFFAIIAFICSIMLFQLKPRTYPIIATLASGLQLAMSYRLVRFSIPGVPHILVLGIILAVTGVLMFLKVNAKNLSAASAILTMIGIVQLLVGLKLLRHM